MVRGHDMPLKLLYAEKIPIGTEIITDIKIAPNVKIKVFLKAGKTTRFILRPETGETPKLKVKSLCKSLRYSFNQFFSKLIVPGINLNRKLNNAVTPRIRRTV